VDKMGFGVQSGHGSLLSALAGSMTAHTDSRLKTAL
jgi:hypothetical protein